MPNPFDKKPPKIGGSPAFKPKAQTQIPGPGYEARLKAGTKMLDDAGVKVGDSVRVQWTFPDHPNNVTLTHHGVVQERDDWLRCKPFSTSNGHLHLPVSALTFIDVIERV